jgi:hypothetical protein
MREPLELSLEEMQAVTEDIAAARRLSDGDCACSLCLELDAGEK